MVIKYKIYFVQIMKMDMSSREIRIWRWMRVSPNELWAFFEYEAKENLIRYSPDFKKIFPNVAKDFKWSENGKTVTFYLRKGMKWSDGAPFTADDFVFWYEDIILNDELTPAKPGWLRVGGELGKLEKVDTYTFKITFTQPYGVFTEKLSGWWAPLLYAPKHYLKQFHPKYTPMEKIKEMMEKKGFNGRKNICSFSHSCLYLLKNTEN